ncbi:hypothetical protein [Alkalinema sp. FACHB-956]|nr:hypothetical protein [Alkalinema sp. FACHB-956]MBD2327680.1 hypothetical protein [Alkalinema sp. FACHB-956]
MLTKFPQLGMGLNTVFHEFCHCQKIAIDHSTPLTGIFIPDRPNSF